MNTLRKIGFAIYQNWLLIFLAAIISSHFIFDTPRLVWPWVLLSLGFSILMVHSAHSSRPFFAPIRMIVWPGLKYQIIQQIKNNNILLTFPLVMYLELEGKNVFLVGGWTALEKGMADHLTASITKLEAGITQMAESFRKMSQEPDDTKAAEIAKEIEAPPALIEKTAEHAKKVE